jgi:hypothetical protein
VEDREECLPVVKHSQVEVGLIILLINVLEVKMSNANATFRTNKSRRKHDDRTKGSNCKNWKSKLL